MSDVPPHPAVKTAVPARKTKRKEEVFIEESLCTKLNVLTPDAFQEELRRRSLTSLWPFQAVKVWNVRGCPCLGNERNRARKSSLLGCRPAESLFRGDLVS